MKPVHRLQIRPIVRNYGAPPTIPQSYIRVHAVVWECGEGQKTDRQTDARDHYTFRIVYDSKTEFFIGQYFEYCYITCILY